MPGAAQPEAVEVSLDGRRLRLTNLDKVMWPASGTTKAELIDYWVRMAPTVLPHYAGRALTLRRWPDGVEKPGFFEKNCPSHAPEWIPRHPGPGGVISSGVEEAAALAWLGNQAAIEVHLPRARVSDPSNPRLLVLDLDPGPPADLVSAAEVARAAGEVLEALGLRSFPLVSGSAGVHLHIPLNDPSMTHERATDFARALGRLLERDHPVVTRRGAANRRGKVLLDWSQNRAAATTIGPYSPRGRHRPTVCTPLTWAEIESARHPGELTFELGEVIERIQRHGDLLADALTLVQHLPG